MTPTEYRQVRATLKKVIKNRNLTYAQLAKIMKTSEVTVKRFFSEDKYSTRLFEICETLELSFFDLVETAKIARKKAFQLTEAQDRFFVKNIGHFAIFREIYRKRSIKEIQKRWKLTNPQMTKVLTPLERLKLIEVLPNNGIRVVPEGVMELEPHSSLEVLLRHELTAPFLTQFQKKTPPGAIYDNGEIEVSPETEKIMIQEIKDMIARFCILGERDRALQRPQTLKSVRWLFCFSSYKTKWESFRPKI